MTDLLKPSGTWANLEQEYEAAAQRHWYESLDDGIGARPTPQEKYADYLSHQSRETLRLMADAGESILSGYPSPDVRKECAHNLTLIYTELAFRNV